jgi:P-type E1-E2 ATPase
MSSIYKMMPSFAQVLRNGVVVDVPTAQLVVGDIVDVKIGDKVPADIRLLSVDQMKVGALLLWFYSTN